MNAQQKCELNLIPSHGHAVVGLGAWIRGQKADARGTTNERIAWRSKAQRYKSTHEAPGRVESVGCLGCCSAGARRSLAVRCFESFDSLLPAGVIRLFLRRGCRGTSDDLETLPSSPAPKVGFRRLAHFDLAPGPGISDSVSRQGYQQYVLQHCSTPARHSSTPLHSPPESSSRI